MSDVSSDGDAENDCIDNDVLNNNLTGEEQFEVFDENKDVLSQKLSKLTEGLDMREAVESEIRSSKSCCGSPASVRSTKSRLSVGSAISQKISPTRHSFSAASAGGVLNTSNRICNSQSLDASFSIANSNTSVNSNSDGSHGKGRSPTRNLSSSCQTPTCAINSVAPSIINSVKSSKNLGCHVNNNCT